MDNFFTFYSCSILLYVRQVGKGLDHPDLRSIFSLPPWFIFERPHQSNSESRHAPPPRRENLPSLPLLHTFFEIPSSFGWDFSFTDFPVFTSLFYF